jgi:hypothetical protein
LEDLVFFFFDEPAIAPMCNGETDVFGVLNQLTYGNVWKVNDVTNKPLLDTVNNNVGGYGM